MKCLHHLLRMCCSQKTLHWLWPFLCLHWLWPLRDIWQIKWRAIAALVIDAEHLPLLRGSQTQVCAHAEAPGDWVTVHAARGRVACLATASWDRTFMPAASNAAVSCSLCFCRLKSPT